MNGSPPSYGQFGEHEYLRAWHWFHRFSMMGRSSQGLWHAEWDMARMRLRDILDAAWNNPAVPVADQFPLAPGTKLGQIFRSERTVALIYRWHIITPANVINGDAAKRLHAIITAAHAAGPFFSANPATWEDAHEQALAKAIIDANPDPGHPTHGQNQPVRDPGHTLRVVADWPDWNAAANPRHYSLPLTAIPAVERELKLARGSFQFDAEGLP